VVGLAVLSTGASASEATNPLIDSLDVDESETSPDVANVLATTADALSPSDAQELEQMLRDGQNVDLVNAHGSGIDSELTAEQAAIEEAELDEQDKEEEDQSVEETAVELEEDGAVDEDSESESNEEDEEDAALLQVAEADADEFDEESVSDSDDAVEGLR